VFILVELKSFVLLEIASIHSKEVYDDLKRWIVNLKCGQKFVVAQ